MYVFCILVLLVNFLLKYLPQLNILKVVICILAINPLCFIFLFYLYEHKSTTIHTFNQIYIIYAITLYMAYQTHIKIVCYILYTLNVACNIKINVGLCRIVTRKTLLWIRYKFNSNLRYLPSLMVILIISKQMYWCYPYHRIETNKNK